jgi:prevent-host-death family protein
VTTVNMHEAKSQLSKLVDLAHQGEDVIIARNGKPTARIVPIESEVERLRPIGLHIGKVVMHDNFDDPLPEEFMKALE